MMLGASSCAREKNVPSAAFWAIIRAQFGFPPPTLGDRTDRGSSEKMTSTRARLADVK